jgi:hypothetical protein
MDKNYQTDMILLDFAQTFDKVSHPRLLHKLDIMESMETTRTGLNHS